MGRRRDGVAVGSGVRRRREVEVGRSLTATTVGRRRRDGEMTRRYGSGGRKSCRGENGSEKMGRKNGGDCTVLKLLILFLLLFTSVDFPTDISVGLLHRWKVQPIHPSCHAFAFTSVDTEPDVIA